MGKEIYSSKITASDFKLQTSDIPYGIYFVQLKSGNQAVIEKLVVQH